MTEVNLSPGQIERRAQIREERVIVAPHRGTIEWRLIAEWALNFFGWIAVFAAAATGNLSFWIAIPVLAVLSSMIYMPLHEATHMNISGDTNHNWLDEVIGRLSGLIFAFGFREHRMSHMKHHAFTNQVGKDPDLITAGSKWQIPVTVLISSVLGLLTPFFILFPPLRTRLPKFVMRRLAPGAARGEEANQRAAKRSLIEVALLIGFSFAGFAAEAWLLWYLPTRLAFIWVGFIFGWYPHHPHQEAERYRDTRTATFFGSTLLIRGHDHHLLHHLYPRVVHYRLPRLWSDIGPTLIERNARVEGKASPDGTPILWN